MSMRPNEAIAPLQSPSLRSASLAEALLINLPFVPISALTAENGNNICPSSSSLFHSSLGARRAVPTQRTSFLPPSSPPSPASSGFHSEHLDDDDDEYDDDDDDIPEKIVRCPAATEDKFGHQ